MTRLAEAEDLGVREDAQPQLRHREALGETDVRENERAVRRRFGHRVAR